MKFEYKFLVGQKVITADNEALFIRSRSGRYDKPAYYMENKEGVYFEDTLREFTDSDKKPKNITTHTSSSDNSSKKIANYKVYLQRLDCEVHELSLYSRNLNRLAIEDKLPKTYGRQEEVDKVKTILIRRTKPNALLTGVSGCGKTAIVEELARQFALESISTEKYSPVIYDLSLNALVSGTRYRGDFEDKLGKIITITKQYPEIIIFIDEVHALIDVGNSEGSVSAGQILKPALARGEFRCIGATTTEEFQKYIATDKALTRRFCSVKVTEITGTAKENCITNIIKDYGEYFNIDVSEVTTNTILNIIENCIPYTTFPDNVVDIIDEALAIAKFNNYTKITDLDIKKTTSKSHGIIIL